MRNLLLPRILIFLFLSAVKLNAQPDISILSSETPSFNACEVTYIEVFLTNDGGFPVPAGSLSIDLSTGLEYLSGSVNGVGVQEADISNLNEPVFQYPEVLPCAGYSFTYAVNSVCGIDGQSYRNIYQISTPFGEVTHESETFGFRRPKVDFFDIQVAFDSVTLEYTRTYILGNIGNTSVEVLILNQRDANSNYEIASVSFGSLSCNNDDCSLLMEGDDFSTVGNNDNLFDPGEFITFSEVLSLVQCLPVRSLYELKWECEDTECSLLQMQHTFEPFIGFPDVKWQYDKYEFAGVCSEGYVDVFIINNGNGPAVDVVLEPGMHLENSNQPARLDCPRLFDFSINGSLLSINPTYDGYGLELWDQGWTSDPDGPGGISDADGDGLYDDLLAGDTIRLSLKVQFTEDCFIGLCTEELLPYRAFIVRNHYWDMCGYEEERLLIRNDHSYWISEPEIETNLEETRIYYDSTAQNLNLRLSRTLAGFPEACTNDSAILRIILPITMELIPGEPVFVNNVPTDFFVTGSEVTILGNFTSGFVQLPILITCDDPDNTNASCITEASGQPGYDISFNLTYYCDKINCSVPLTLYCEESACFQVACFGGGGPGGDNDCLPNFSHELQIERTSLGWTDPGQNQLVSPGTDGLSLNYAMSHDTLQFKLTQASFGGDTCLIFNNLARISFQGYPEIVEVEIRDSSYFDTTYMLPFEWLEEMPFTFTFQDIASGQTISCDISGLPFEIIQYNGTHFAYEVRDLQTLFEPGGCLAGFEHNPGDGVELGFFASVIRESLPSQPFDVGNLFGLFGSDFTNWNWGSYNITNPLYLSNGTVQPYVDVIGSSCSEGYCAPVEVVSGFVCPTFPYVDDPFPLEFRPLAEIDEISMEIPLNLSYEPNSSTLSYWLAQGDSLALVSLPIADPVIETSPNCDFYTLNYQNNSWPLMDYLSGKQYKVTAMVSALCPNGESNPAAFRQLYTSHLYTNEIYQEDQVYVDTGQVRFAPRDFIVADPVFDSSTDSLVQWSFTICNPNPYDDTLYTLYNNWIAFEPSNDNLHNFLLERINDPNNPETIPLVDYGSSSGIWAQLGDLESDTCFVFRFSAIASSGIVSKIEVIQGTDCKGYPSDPDLIPCFCQPLRRQLCHDPQSAKLVIDCIQQPDSLELLCDVLDYEVRLSNIDFGVAYNCQLDLVFPFGPGLEIVPGSCALSFPDGNGFVPITDPSLIEPFHYQWAIMDFIDSLYLTGVDKRPFNSVKVKFQLRSNCDFQNGSFVMFAANGEDLFGAPMEAVPAFSNALKTPEAGTVNINNYLLDMQVLPKDNCDEMLGFRFVIHNGGGSDDNLTAADESIQIVVNNGFDYQVGSLVNVLNFPEIAPELRERGGFTYLRWALPAGVAMGDSIVWELVLANSCSSNCNLVDLAMQTISPRTMECQNEDSGFCLLDVLNTEKIFEDIPLSPNYLFTTIAANSIPNGSGMEEMTVEFELTDTSAINGYGDLTVGFYFDVNGNGQFDPLDSLLWTEEVNANGILSGTSRTFSSTYNLPTRYACSIIAVLNPQNNDCICYATEIPVPAPGFQLNAPDLSICYGSPLQLDYPSADGYSIQWGNTTNLDSYDIFNPSYQLTGPPGPDSVFTEELVAIVTRNGNCSSDSVSVDSILVSTYMVNAELLADSMPSGFSLSCASAADGLVEVIIEYGTAPYTFQWSTGDSGSELTGLVAGTYILTITDEQGCVDIDSINLSEPPRLELELTITEEIACHGTAEGTVAVMAEGGNGVYEYNWSSGSTDATATNLSTGWAFVTVTDENGCTMLDSVSLSQPEPITAESVSTTANCLESNSGAATITAVSGGTAPYYYLWDDPDQQNTPAATNLLPGEYHVSITDENDCRFVTSLTVEVREPPSPEIEIQLPDCVGDQNGQAEVKGLSTTFLHSLNNSPFQSDPLFADLGAGMYVLTLEDDYGCVFEYDFDISEPLAIDVIAYKDSTLELGQEIRLRAQDLYRPAVSFEWTPPDYLDCTDCDRPVSRPAEDIVYEVKVVDENGCTATSRVKLQVRKFFDVYVPNVFTPNGDGVNDGFTIYGGPRIRLIRELKIYDRWGEHVFTNENFEPNNPEYGWDGTLKGRPMNPAVFVYWAKVIYSDGQEKLIKGDVTLIR